MLEQYKNKRVLVTGHTGFKGGWLCLWLHKLGAEVLGYSLEPDTDFYNSIELEKVIDKSVFGDILDIEKLQKTINDFKPEIIFHLAAQPIVRLSYTKPLLTYKTNVIGTLNVLEASRKCSSVTAFVNITTDKCYENTETNEGYSEEMQLGGYDMYSSSKACVEIMSASYRQSFLQNSYSMATVRAGNVIGGGDWAKDRLIPDCVRAIQNNEAIKLRNPNSVRPWQFVLEPLSGYLLIGCKLLTEGNKFASSYNLGPNENNSYKVSEIVNMFINSYGKGSYETEQDNEFHEAGLLNLNIQKVLNMLGWQPSYNTQKAVSETALWYKKYYEKAENMYNYSVKQISDYEECIKWNKN